MQKWTEFLRAITPFFSILVPGSSQLILKKTWRGITIFITTVLLAFLVNWAYTKFDIGKVQVSETSAFTWLAIPLVLFYLWNVIDGFKLAANKKSSVYLLLSALVILYVIGWAVTGVKLDRLVTRFDDARTVMNRLFNPDIFSTYEGDKVVMCDWGCIWDYTTAKIQGRETQDIFLSTTIGQLFGQKGTITAPGWKVLFGLAEKNQRIPGYETGKLVETIAIGLLANRFSTILAVPRLLLRIISCANSGGNSFISSPTT